MEVVKGAMDDPLMLLLLGLVFINLCLRAYIRIRDWGDQSRFEESLRKRKTRHR